MTPRGRTAGPVVGAAPRAPAEPQASWGSPRSKQVTWCDPLGIVHGGLVCTLADTVAGCAVQTTLGPGTGFTSIDITVNYLRPVTLDSGTLLATGSVTKPGRRVAFAAAEIHDHAGRLVATATSSCLAMTGREPGP